jgi:hypothetical protein
MLSKPKAVCSGEFLSFCLVRTALLGRGIGVHSFNDIRLVHDGFRQAGRHCRRHPKRLVNAQEVIPDRVNCDHVSVVLKLFAERICEPSEAAIVHPHRQVSPFRIGRACLASSAMLAYSLKMLAKIDNAAILLALRNIAGKRIRKWMRKKRLWVGQRAAAPE